jgi:uncharacterized membrane protein YgdD (TMEM256/DUF423 family)
MNKRIILTASIFGILAVILGAFGSHGLKGKIESSDLGVWKTAVEYQFYHVFALIFLSSFSRFHSRLINIASYAFTLGIVLFSGSLYILSTKAINNISWTSYLGPVTPIGGILFIIGWLCLFLSTLKNK